MPPAKPCRDCGRPLPCACAPDQPARADDGADIIPFPGAARRDPAPETPDDTPPSAA